jgi:photosystem II stability/assembly factor-like uncharacterized protein
MFARKLFTSDDAGVTWKTVYTPSKATDEGVAWNDLAMSADGSKILAVGDAMYQEDVDNVPYDGSYHYEYVKVGNVFYSNPSCSSPTDDSWKAVVSSADGTRLLALGSQISTSRDSGKTWIVQTAGPTGYIPWSNAAISTDGTKIVAVTSGAGIYTSTNAGVAWTQRTTTSQKWVDVASSADGTKLVAVVAGGYVYTSSGPVP